jgi:hypothetical protein
MHHFNGASTSGHQEIQDRLGLTSFALRTASFVSMAPFQSTSMLRELGGVCLQRNPVAPRSWRTLSWPPKPSIIMLEIIKGVAVQVVNKYGADALRLYLINSPVVRAEPLRFEEKGVYEVVKSVFLPWYNAYRFLAQNVVRVCSSGGSFNPMATLEAAAPTNVLDRWLQAATRTMVAGVRQEMDAYHLNRVVPNLLRFIDSLTNVYVRLNRGRLKGRSSPEDSGMALATLFDSLVKVCHAPLLVN